MATQETVLKMVYIDPAQAGWGMQLVETASNLFTICLDNRIQYMNPAGLELLGVEKQDDILGKELSDFIHGDYKEFFAFGLDVLAEEDDFIPLKFLKQDQTSLDVKLQINEIQIANQTAYIVEVQNITEYKRASEAVRDREHRLKSILNTVTEGIMTFDDEAIIQTFNPAAEKIFGISSQNIIGKPIETLMTDEFRDSYMRFLDRKVFKGNSRLMGKPWELFGYNEAKGKFPLEMTITKLQVANERIYTAVFRDITERKQSEERIRHLAHHDTLTGLPNRHLFTDRLNHAVKVANRYNKALVLMFVDLDKFKPINDTLGHEAGDVVLQTVAKRFSKIVRESDTVARIGGDEFVILLEELDSSEGGNLVAEKLLECLEKPIPAGGRECSLGASIGIARFPEDAMDTDELLRCADEAMYAVKTSGRNGYKVYEPNLSVLG
ncbi:diguanylate cyclase [Terasakiella sp. A23]|uniref:diguanylate cyclase domain-containing protein n=1 Tax=Terasakiella sp. FCG-A23 TaxID=3080561 RepID=UPI002952FCDC|nr:diguanylate cyclase [Terasakiella sp. A23]MDV7339402.1 diguanylate cyclase [Terasakiella sp. A23]